MASQEQEEQGEQGEQEADYSASSRRGSSSGSRRRSSSSSSVQMSRRASSATQGDVSMMEGDDEHGVLFGARRQPARPFAARPADWVGQRSKHHGRGERMYAPPRCWRST